MLRKITSLLAVSCLIVLFLLCFVASGQIADGIAQGIKLCCEVLIPSLFLFLILSDLLEPLLRGKKIPRPLQWFSKHILHMDGRLLYVFVLGMLGGYPIGAKLIAGEVEKKHIGPDDALYLLRFCICCSPAFLISSVARVIWNNMALGAVLYGIQVLSAILIAFFTGYRHYVFYHTTQQPPAEIPFSSRLVQATTRSVKQMGMICGFLLLFCGLFGLLERLPLSSQALLWVKGILEVTVGCQLAGELPALVSPLIVAAFTSFGGLCVHLQILSLCGGISLRYPPFLFYRLLYAFLSTVLSAVALQLFPQVATCFVAGGTSVLATEYNLFTSFLMLVLCCMLLLLFDRPSHKEKKP